MRRAVLLAVPLAAFLALAGLSAHAGTGTSDPIVDTTEFDQATMGDTDSGDREDFGEGTNRTLPGAKAGKGKRGNRSYERRIWAGAEYVA